MKKKPEEKNKKSVVMDQEVFDIVVVGAGPVGLIFAKELAEKHRRVLLVEKEKTITPRKSWLLPKQWAHQAGYGAYSTNIITKGGFYSHLNDFDIAKTAPKEYHCVAIDEDKFYQETLQALKESGCQLSPNTEAQNYSLGNSFIEIKNDRSNFRGRLLLDCSGVDSPFVKRGNNLKHEFYWSVYGQTYTGVKVDPTQTSLAHIGDHEGDKILINDVPEGSGRYTPWLFFMSPKKYPINELKQLYSQAVKSNFLKDKLAGSRPIKEKCGWIPAADVKSHAQNRILSLGDAGAFGPWQSGMSFSLMLKKLKTFATRIEQCLAEDKLDEKNLNQVVKLDDKEELNFDLGKFLFLFMMNSNGEEFKKCLQNFLSDDSFKKTCSVLLLDASLGDFKTILTGFLSHFSITELLKILGRDGWADEVKIGSEAISDFIKNLT